MSDPKIFYANTSQGVVLSSMVRLQISVSELR